MLEIAEKRSKLRRRVLKDGKAVIQPPTGMVDVKIRDLSESGAKLEISATMTLPEKFDLIFVSEELSIPSELMWRRGNFAGVHFSGPKRKIVIKRF